MKKTKIVTILSLILVGIVSVMTITSFGDVPEKTSDDKKANSEQTVISEKNSARIDDLVRAWSAAGINAEVKEKSSDSTLNSMYGCINQYTVLLDDEQFMIFEYDLKDLNSTAERYLKFIDKNGYDPKTDDPAWHNQEFLLRNTYSVLENGAVVAEFQVTEHPKSEQILEVFQSFK